MKSHVPATATRRCKMLRATYGHNDYGGGTVKTTTHVVEAEIPAYGFQNKIPLPKEARYTAKHLMSLTFFERVTATTQDGIELSSADLAAQRYAVVVPMAGRPGYHMCNVTGGSPGDGETSVLLTSLCFAERAAEAA